MQRSSEIVFSSWLTRVLFVLGGVGLPALGCSDTDRVRPLSGTVTPSDIPPPEVDDEPDAEGEADVGSAGVEGDPSEPGVLSERVSALLERACGACHSNGRSDGGLGDLPALTTLIEQREIVPGSSEASLLLIRLRAGSMPPPGVIERLSAGEIELIARYIDELSPTADASCAALPLIRHDQLFETLLADARGLDPVLLPFSRYVGLLSASNAGTCGSALERERQALFKLVNSVSTAPDVHQPEPVDADGLIFRIDLRNYGWNRPLDLEDDGAVDFDDGWLAIVDRAGAYAVSFAGSDADPLELLAGTPVPYLPSSALIVAASSGDLYYSLIDAKANVYDTELRLGIDTDLSIADGAVARAGFDAQGASRNEEMVLRLGQSTASRYYWLLGYDDGVVNSSSIYIDPFDLWNDNGQEVIYHLPNGMFAFAVGASNGARLAEVPFGCVGLCEVPQGNIVSAGCQGCHHAGLLPVEDQVRPVVERNSRAFDVETFAAVQEQYPTPAEFAQIVESDNAIHLDAMTRAGVSADGPDPIGAVYFDFERPLNAGRAAAELGVTRRELLDSLAQLDVAFRQLDSVDARIERSAFTSVYARASCTLLGASRNVPEACPAP